MDSINDKIKSMRSSSDEKPGKKKSWADRWREKIVNPGPEEAKRRQLQQILHEDEALPAAVRG